MKKIAPFAFAEAKLTYVTIPASVTEIGANAFREMQTGSIIKVNRSESGMNLGNRWNGYATVTFKE